MWVLFEQVFDDGRWELTGSNISLGLNSTLDHFHLGYAVRTYKYSMKYGFIFFLKEPFLRLSRSKLIGPSVC